MTRFFSFALSSALLAGSAGLAAAQTSVPPNQVSPFTDTSILKPPANTKVAILEWEDLECPACAKAFPVVHAAINKYHVPLLRHDFQIPGHIWSHEASIYARYLEDKVSADVATDYRRQVFASQFRIASKDDLNRFTQQFFASHNQKVPFVIDPTGQFEKEVNADHQLGERLGLHETPTIIVVTPRGWIQVKDSMMLYQAIDQAEALAATPAPTQKAAPRPTTKKVSYARP